MAIVVDLALPLGTITLLLTDWYIFIESWIWFMDDKHRGSITTVTYSYKGALSWLHSRNFIGKI